MTDVALIREDGEGTMPLAGAVRVSVDYPATVTDYPIPDRTHITDGVVLYPRRCRIDAVVNENKAGSWTIKETAQFLETLQTSAIPVGVQIPRSGLLPAMLVESYRLDTADTDGVNLSIALKGAIFAETSYVQVSQLRGEPPAAVRGAVQDPIDTGECTTEVIEERDQSPLFLLGSAVGLL